MRILLTNINGLAGILPIGKHKLAGKEMSDFNTLSNAYLLIEDGLIHSFGNMAECPENADKTLDCNGRFVIPAWCDSHTHLVYAASRHEEFVKKLKGISYEEIAAQGGGILNSAKMLASTPESKLIEDALGRIDEIKSFGTASVEIKSGYGLSYEAELKMLRVIQELKIQSNLSIKATFLGAHAFPAEYKSNQEEYIKLLIEKLLPEIADKGLADFIDVFCEKGYFDATQTSRILEAGAKYGLIPKVHVNQFSAMGGVGVSVRHQARSVDHLECITEEDLAILKDSNTMPVALPGCSLFLKIPYTDGRRIIQNDLPLALASDFNPGSSPSGNMNLVIALACSQMRLLPEEALNAATINGAYAMMLENECGSITVGKKAKLVITKKMNSLDLIPYYFGSNLVEQLIL